MVQNLKRVLPGIFYFMFGLLFSSLVLRLLVREDAPPFAPLLLAVMLTLLAAFYRFLSRHEEWLEKRYSVLLAVFLVGFGTIQLITARLLCFQPAFDLDAIYSGAIEWAETGSFRSFYQYYSYFPNNLGGMAFLAVFFSIAHRLGFTGYFMIAAVVNGLCSLCAMLVTTAVCRKLLGVRYAVFAMALFVLSPPFYFIAAVFYTDSLSMLFPVLVYYLYLKVRESEILWQRMIFSGLLGLAAGIGMLIKFTVAVMLIAVLIDSLFYLPIKRTAVLAGISFAVIGVGFLSFRAMIYPAHLDQDQAKRFNTPYLHWVMMGLKGDGGYNGEDYNFTRSFATTEERDAALADEIARRLEELGPRGVYKLFWTKTTKNFSSGTFNQSDFLDDNPMNENSLHSWLLYDGENYQTYRDLCQLVFLAALALMALSGLGEMFGKREESPTWRYLAPRLAVFGVLLFFACWETSARYVTNFVPLIFLSAALGIDRGSAALKRTAAAVFLRRA